MGEGERILAEAISAKVEQKLRRIYTCVPVVVKTVKRKDNVPYRVDVVLKNDPESPIIPGLPIVSLRGGDASIILPVTPGDVALAFFSMVGIDDLVIDKEQRRPSDPRRFSAMDAFVLPGFFVENEAVPAGYAIGDLVVRAARVVIGDGASLKPVLVEGDSNAGGAISASQSKVYVAT